MLKISDVLKVKGDILFTIDPNQSLQQALETMADNDIGSIVVMEHGELAGILTYRQIIKCVAQPDRDYRAITVRTVMDDAPVTIAPNTSFEEGRRLLIKHGVRYAPVMDGTTLLGVVSFTDMARAAIEQNEFEKNMLKAYIKDWPDEQGSDRSEGPETTAQADSATSRVNKPA
ncbi:CBS domain-containing protein [Brackiella oedipodis]|uniref:CBS domain-containing protein n=1 Tax=Brackiella oedipodis TaxID=124225 RepID=UPI0009FBDA69|nr:CBS domain-containing protein [Brackiella oedipodis]